MGLCVPLHTMHNSDRTDHIIAVIHMQHNIHQSRVANEFRERIDERAPARGESEEYIELYDSVGRR